MRAILIAMTLALIGFMGEPVSANEVDDWKYRGSITWQHPDGRSIRGVYANSKVNDDRMSIIRDQSTGQWYIQFYLRDNARLENRRARFFILDGPVKKTARRVYFEIDGISYPGDGSVAGVIVSRLTQSDRNAMRRFSGNLIGVVYTSYKFNEDQPKRRNYTFSGRNLARTLALFDGGGRDPNRDFSRDTNPRPPVTNRSGYVRYQVRWNNCSRPTLRTLQTRSAANRFRQRALAYERCRNNNSRRVRRELQSHVQSQGGTFKITRKRNSFLYNFGQPPGCNCRTRFNANIRAVITAIDNYIARTKAYMSDANREIRTYNQRA
ncbi:MAG: hypothetical protein AAGM04_01075 [Pseudomonadota bacterium]